MVFNFRKVIISGTTPGVEGVSVFLQEAKTFLEGAGWTTVEDRSGQAGSSDSSLTHKIVFSSKGESGDNPTFYMTLFSGVAEAAANSQVSFLVHTAYDTVTHQVPSSGISSNATHSQNNNTPLAVRSTDSVSEVWMSGDADAVTFVVKRISNSTFDSATVGKWKSFYSRQEEPYGLFINSSATTNIHTGTLAAWQGVFGEPPRRCDGTTSTPSLGGLVISLATTQQPYNAGAATSIFQAVPILATLTDNAADQQGILGMLPNTWEGVGTNHGLLSESVLTSSGTDFGARTYRAFCLTANSLIIRET